MSQHLLATVTARAKTSMRNHPRPFVVEVKRGTSRQSFQSHSSDSDKFSAAERLLFSKAQIEPIVTAAAASQTKAGQAGRVLPALSDAQEIVLVDPFPTPRRGRPPGSKNKAKPMTEVLAPQARLSIFETVSDIETTSVDDRHNAPSIREEVSLTPALPDPPAASTTAPIRATRLRDRSRILRRYVLGTEPRAGERTSFRKKKGASSNGKRSG